MRRLILLTVLFVLALAVTAAGGADPGKSHGKRGEAKAERHAKQSDVRAADRKKDDDDDDQGDDEGDSKNGVSRFTYTLVSGEDGCHGQPWEVSSVRRTYEVRSNGNGTYRLRRSEVGTFRTTGPESPGNCATTRGPHGTHVHAGATGRTVAFREGTVTPAAGHTFNPNGSCAASCTQDAFLAAFFGPGASFSCYGNSSDCKFLFDFKASDEQGLAVRHWQFRGTGSGTALRAVSIGDVSDDVVASSRR